MSLSVLGGRGKAANANRPPQAPAKQRASPKIKYLCWNTGGLTSSVWEELLSQLADPQYADVSLVILQETHWTGVSQFTTDCWHVISSGSSGEKGAGAAILVKKTLCKAQSIRHTEVVPGRILHVRVPGADVSLDVISVHQFVRRSSIMTEAKKSRRQKLLGPCTVRGPKLIIRSVSPLQKLLEDHQLVALNTWAAGKPSTHVQGNSVSQIDFVLGRVN